MNYAIVVNGAVVNVAICESAEFAASQGWIACEPEVSIGWSYDGNTFNAPIENRPSWEEQEAALLRAERNQKLAETDWVIAKYAETDGGVPQVWRDYRQALRDLPQKPDFPRNFVWPVKPE